MKRNALLVPAALAFLFCCVGCGSEEADGANAPDPADEAEPAEEAAPTTHASPLFPQRDGERVTGGPAKDAACEYLTAGRAAAILEVPEGELEEAGRCGFRWRSDTHVAEITIGRVYVYGDVEASQLSFATATENRAAAETQDEAAEVLEGAAEALEVNGVDGDIIAAAANFEQRYEPVEGIGDEAAFAVHDGQVIVRISNLRFAVTAFKCPRPPEGPTPTRAQARDIEAVAREARARANRWIADTIDVRRQMASTLAQGVAGALEDFRASL